MQSGDVSVPPQLVRTSEKVRSADCVSLGVGGEGSGSLELDEEEDEEDEEDDELEELDDEEEFEVEDVDEEEEELENDDIDEELMELFVELEVFVEEATNAVELLPPSHSTRPHPVVQLLLSFGTTYLHPCGITGNASLQTN